MKFKFLFIAITLVACNNQSKTTNKVISSRESNKEFKSEQLKKSSTDNIIKLKLNNFRKIKGYKNTDFKSKEFLYDDFLQPVTSQIYDVNYSQYNATEEPINEDKTFFIDTDYGKVKFESVEDGDMFLEYHYFNKIIVVNYKVISVSTIDSPMTLFLNNKEYNGFVTSGTVYFSKDNKYFVSLSNTPEFCLLEFYEVTNNEIINIINLYSLNHQIDSMCWNKELLFETPEINNKREYYKIDYMKILNSFKSETLR